MPRASRHPLRGLGVAVDEAAAAGGPKVGSFLRGVTIGAFVGAAIAGSVLLQRRRPPRAPLAEAGSTRADTHPEALPPSR